MMKRSFFFYFILVLAFAGMLFRCFWLASGENAVHSKTVIAGREREITLYNTKGLIYDEKLKAIAGNQPCWYLVVNPREFEAENLEELLALTKADETNLKEKLKKETPFVLKSEEQPDLMRGVEIFEGVCRYSGVAQHLLGYLDNVGEVGVAGVEKEYNDFLNLYLQKVKVTYRTDAVQGVIAGLGLTTQEAEPTENGLILTLDKDLCQALEGSMRSHIETGAAVVLDCKTGAIKAICSSPGYDEEKIAEYLNSQNGELINRALSAQTVGSVFKIILAACALEAGMEGFIYDCRGGILVGERTFACHNHSGHGTIGMESAFSQSCNAYFIALGQLLGYDPVAEMARRLGFDETIEVLGAICASKGTFPVKSSSLSLANMSIGQGELTSSPLQIARMTSVIANGGTMPTVHLYKGLYIDGEIKTEEKPEGDTRVLQESHAEILRRYCIDAVENGTGKEAKPTLGSAGGKTASAQTGIIKDGTEKLNVYFTGFYPAENPRYVITVFAENGVSGGGTCGPVFREICDFIAENNLTEIESMIY